MKNVIKKLISRFQLMLIILFVLLVIAAFALSVFSENTARLIIFGIMIYVVGIILYLSDLDKKVLSMDEEEEDQNDK